MSSCSSAPLVASPSADSEASLSSATTSDSAFTDTSASSYTASDTSDMRPKEEGRITVSTVQSSDEESSSGSSRATRRVKFPSNSTEETGAKGELPNSATEGSVLESGKAEASERTKGQDRESTTTTAGVTVSDHDEPSHAAVYQPASPHKSFRRSYTTASISSVPFNTRAGGAGLQQQRTTAMSDPTRPPRPITSRSHSSANVSSMATSPSSGSSLGRPIEDASRSSSNARTQPQSQPQSHPHSHAHSHSMSLSLSSPGSSSSVTSPTTATRHAPPRRQTTASFSSGIAPGGGSAALSALYNTQSDFDRSYNDNNQQFGDTRRHSVDYLSAIAAASNNSQRGGLRSPPVVDPSPSNYSSLAADPRWRKTSLGSQTLLSSTGDLNLMSAQSSSSSSSLVGNRAHVSPTRTRDDASSSSQYLAHANPHPHISHATSPRFDSSVDEQQHRRTNQLEAKIVLLGRQGVGKTSLVHRYNTGQFSSSLPTTIGASFLVKKLVMDGVKVRLQIWDTAGQERFRSMAPMYYRGAHAAILVYDITNEESLADIQVWLDELRRNMSSDLMIQIVGHKADLAPTHRRVTLEHAKTQISQWIVSSSSSSSSAAPTLGAPTNSRRFPSGSSSTAQGAEEANTSNSGGGRPSLTSFGLSRTASKNKDTKPEQAQLEPVWKDIAISEVSAKEDAGIEDLFLTIASKLVERKVQIENDRILRSKDSIMITDEQKTGNKADDPTRVWGCC